MQWEDHALAVLTFALKGPKYTYKKNLEIAIQTIQ